jgi:hypothetical protein
MGAKLCTNNIGTFTLVKCQWQNASYNGLSRAADRDIDNEQTSDRPPPPPTSKVVNKLLYQPTIINLGRMANRQQRLIQMLLGYAKGKQKRHSYLNTMTLENCGPTGKH